MAQDLQLKIAGIYTNYNEFSEVPPGALLVADNIDILSKSIAQSRRGFDWYLDVFSANAADVAYKTFFYQSTSFVHYGETEGTALARWNGSSWAAVGSYNAPSGYRMRTQEANQNIYFTTSAGVKKLDSSSATVRASGAVKGLDIRASTSASASTWLPDLRRVAYRCVWGYEDANKNLILGSPSQREIYTNVSGSQKAVDLAITIPTDVTTSWLLQIYRTAAITITGASDETDPGDDEQLVYSTNPAGADISAKLITITDITPDSLRGASLYTNENQEGIAYANEPPPQATDMAVFRDCIFYSNTTAKQRFTLTLLSVGGTGIDVNGTITIGGVVYTGKASETIASGQFKITTTGSAAQNIRDTATSLIRVINRYASSTIYAYYISGIDDLPGQILLEERGIGGATFAITSSNQVCWNPTIPSSGTSQSSVAERLKNGLAWSKPSQPESVPLPNYLPIGNKDNEIKRIIPLQNALLIMKDMDEGVYRLTGYYPNFTLDLLDSTVQILAPETAVVLNNQIFCLCNQGVFAVGDSGAGISLPIEDQLRRLIAENLAGIAAQAFSLAYEDDRKFIMFMPALSGDTHPTFAFVFNIFTRAWTRYVFDANCGVIFDNKIYLGGPGQQLIEERKNYDFTDFVDMPQDITISVISGQLLTISNGFDLIAIGDVISQGADLFANVEAVDPLLQKVRIVTDPGFTVGDAEVLKTIPTEIRWVPSALGNPGIQKQIHTCELIFKKDFSGTGYVTFETDLSPNPESVPVTGQGASLWGMFPWGDEAWGGDVLRRTLRQWVPRLKQRGPLLITSFTLSVGYSEWQLEGISLIGTPGSERTAR